jgi:hypothetical protein
VDSWQSDLDAARAGLARVSEQVLGWLRVGAIAVPVVCVWLAAGQVCLFARALRWCKGA